MSYRIWDEEPTRRISALENPEEHEHSVLTIRPTPILSNWPLMKA